jgi:phosphonate transport system substrate-binding protein
MKRSIIIFLVALGLLAPWTWAKADERESTASGSSFVIGLSPEQNIFKEVERYTPLADYLTKKCGFDVRVKVLTRYGQAAEDFTRQKIDAAFIGSYAYVLAHRKFGVEPLARAEGLNGSSVYHGLLFVRQDSGIRTVNDMRGKSFAFVDPETMAGYLLPLFYFRTHGIRDYKAFLGETYFTGTHEDAVYDVLNRKADIGAAKSTVYHRLAEGDKGIEGELKILSRSPDVPDFTLAVRRDLNPLVRTAVTRALLKMDADPEGREVLKSLGALRFIPTADREYEPVRAYERQLGFNAEKGDRQREH